MTRLPSPPPPSASVDPVWNWPPGKRHGMKAVRIRCSAHTRALALHVARKQSKHPYPLLRPHSSPISASHPYPLLRRASRGMGRRHHKKHSKDKRRKKQRTTEAAGSTSQALAVAPMATTPWGMGMPGPMAAMPHFPMGGYPPPVPQFQPSVQQGTKRSGSSSGGSSSDSSDSSNSDSDSSSSAIYKKKKVRQVGEGETHSQCH